MRSACSIVLVALSMATSATPLQATTTFAVTTTMDAPDATPGDGLCETAPGNGVCTLRAATTEAATGPDAATIDVPAGHYALGDGIEVTNVAAIVGAGADTFLDFASTDPAISRSWDDPVFELEIRDLTLRNTGGVGISTGVHRLYNLTSLSNVVVTGCADMGVENTWPFGDIAISGSRLTDNQGFGLWQATNSAQIVDTSIDHNRSGGILLDGDGWQDAIGVTLDRSRVEENRIVGIANTYGYLTSTDSIIRSNDGDGYDGNADVFAFSRTAITGNAGGGIASVVAFPSTIDDSTVSDNAFGVRIITGGVWGDPRVTIRASSIVANHGIGVEHAQRFQQSTFVSTSILADNDVADCSGPILEEHDLVEDIGNCTPTATTLVGVDPRLGPLRDNGGGTLTHALLPGSPAIDAAGACQGIDQRGFDRPVGAECDVGAFEAGGGSVLALRARADTSSDGANGYVTVKMQFPTSPPTDAFTTASAITLRISDGLALAASCTWSPGDCTILPRGRAKCRTADRNARITIAPSRSTRNAWVATASCRGLAFTGPFQTPFAVTLGQGTDVQRQGTIDACIGTESAVAKCRI